MHLVLVLWVVVGTAASKYSEYEARSSQYDYGEQGAIPIGHSVEEQKPVSQPGEYADNEYLDAEQEFVWENILPQKSSKHKAREKYIIPKFGKTSPIDESDDDVETMNKSNFRNRKTINEVLRYSIKSRRNEIKDDVVLRRSTLSINPFEENIPNDEDQEPVDKITNDKSNIELTEKIHYKHENRDMNLADEGDYTKTPSVSRKHRVGKQRRGLQQSTEPSKNEDYIYDDVKRLRKYEQNITASQNMAASKNTTTLKWGSENLINLYGSSTLKKQTTTVTTSYDLEVTLDDEQHQMFTVRQPYQDHHFYESIGNEISTGETSAMPQEDQEILVAWLDGSTPDPSQQKNPEETKNIPDLYLEKAKQIIRERLLNQSVQDLWVSNKRDILVCGYIELGLLELEGSSTVVLVNHFILMSVCGLLIILN